MNKRVPGTALHEAAKKLIIDDSIFKNLSTYDYTPVPELETVIFNGPATIVFWADKTKTIVKCEDSDEYNPELGILRCIAKKAVGNSINIDRMLLTAQNSKKRMDNTRICVTEVDSASDVGVSRFYKVKNILRYDRIKVLRNETQIGEYTDLAVIGPFGNIEVHHVTETPAQIEKMIKEAQKSTITFKK